MFDFILVHVLIIPPSLPPFFFFFNDTATTEIYTLSLHDALPICKLAALAAETGATAFSVDAADPAGVARLLDRKSTRLNSSHQIISYAVFCLKKKKKKQKHQHMLIQRMQIV